MFMANIQRKFYTSSSTVAKNKGTGIPSWYPDLANKSTWDYDGTTTTDWFYYSHDKDVYLQYGENTSIWAGCRHYVYSVRVNSETQNDDGSIHVSGQVQMIVAGMHNTDFAAGGASVQTKIKIGGKQVYAFNGNTNNEWQTDQFTNNPVSFDVTIQPSQTYDGTTLEISNVYPNHEFNDNTIKVGFALFNPNPPSYTPCGVKQSEWKSCNRNNKANKKKASGSWVVLAEENLGTELHENTGHVRCKQENKWKQSKNMDRSISN